MSSSKEIAALKPKEKRYSVAIENGYSLLASDTRKN